MDRTEEVFTAMDNQLFHESMPERIDQICYCSLCYSFEIQMPWLRKYRDKVHKNHIIYSSTMKLWMSLVSSNTLV